MGTTRVVGTQVLARDGTLLAPGDDANVTVVDAVPIRRTPTDVRALLTSSLAAMATQARAADVTLDVSVDDRVPPIVRIDADKIAWAVRAARVTEDARRLDRRARESSGDSPVARHRGPGRWSRDSRGEAAGFVREWIRPVTAGAGPADCPRLRHRACRTYRATQRLRCHGNRDDRPDYATDLA